MGWSFSFDRSQSKANFVDELNRNFSPGYVLLQHRVVGNHLWQLVQHPEGYKFIRLALMARGRGPHGWGYKGIDETWGPTAVDCPLPLLDAADPPVGENAAEWRERVRKHHAARKERPTLGAGRRVMYGDVEYTLKEPAGPRRGWYVISGENGYRYRMTARQLAQARVLP